MALRSRRPWRLRLRRRPRRNLRKRVMRRATARTSIGHQFTRIDWRQNAFQLTGAGGVTLGAYTFKLSDLPNYTEFTSLYDQYKINKVQVTFIPKINGAMLNAGAQLPVIHSMIDSSDATPPATLAEMMENEDVKSTRGNQLHKRYFTPKCQTKLYEGIGTDGYAVSRRNPFISTDDPAVPHYALKWCIENPVSGGDIYWYCDVKVKYYLSMREVQ